MGNYLKCGDCMYLNGRKTSVGIECMQKDNQAKWARVKAKREKAGAFYPDTTARYKSKSAKACKKYKPKGELVDCSWRRYE